MPEVRASHRHEGSAALPVVGSWIAGRVVADPAAETSEVFDPGVGTATRLVAHAGPDVVDGAVTAAAAAFEQWRDVPQNRRFALLMRLREIVVGRRRDLEDAIVAEGGKARPDAEGELNRTIDGLDSLFSFPVALAGTRSEQVANGIDTHTAPHPLGVVGVITPFNFPAMVPLWNTVAALVCGNGAILKPSPRVPSAAVLLAELIEEAGFPRGLCNVVQGDAATANAILDHPCIAAVSFVGSTPVAEHVYTRGCAAGKRVQAMGGAKNHMVVMPDADLEFAAESLVSGAFGSSGQRCMAVTVAVAVGDAAEPLRELLAERIPRLRVGPGSDQDNDMGAVISRDAQRRICDLIAGGVEGGADLVIDGRALVEREGFFVGPTLFDHLAPGMSVYDEEIFGPVLGILRVASLEEAIALIDRNPYGNGATIFTSSGAAARRFQREASAGMVGINVPIPVPVNSFSTGGWKASVFGAHGLLGPEAFRFYTHQKVVTTRWPESGAQSMGMAFNPGR